MRTETFEGSVESYAGKAVEPARAFRGSAEVYENVAEAKASEDWPSDAEICKIVNQKKVTAAKATEYQKVTADLKKEYEQTPEFKRAGLIKALVLAGKSKADAEAMADTLLA
jgi:hypothetical protein